MTLIMHFAPHDPSIKIFNHLVSLCRVQSNESCPKPNDCELILQKQSTLAFVLKGTIKSDPENNLTHSADVTLIHTVVIVLLNHILFYPLFSSPLNCANGALFTVTPHNFTQFVAFEQ